jgi:hypothetical protein
MVALGLALSFSGACKEAPQQPLVPPPATSPVKPPDAAPAKLDAAPARPKMVANPDGLSLADRIAKRQAEEKKVADALAAEEHERVLKYDRGKLALHTQVFGFITKSRGAWDALEQKLGKDKAADKAAIDKLAAAQRPAIVAMAKKMATIDPQGGNSNVTTDYDVMLNLLANDYPDAMTEKIEGDPKPLEEHKAELDKRIKKVSDYLAEVKAKKK